MKKIMTICALGLFLTGCGTTGGPNQTAGTFLGAGAGALIGSQFGGGSGRVAGAAVGTLGGALVGGAIGREMDLEGY
jgi:uncharacterized protein YcfJ